MKEEKKKRVFRQKDSVDYVDNKLFAAAITNWINENKDNGKKVNWTQMPNYIADCIIKIVDHYALKGNWRSYTYLDLMKSEAIINLVRGIHNYNINISPNAFSYATQIVTNSFRQILKDEKEQAYIKNETISRESIYNYNNINLNDSDEQEMIHE